MEEASITQQADMAAGPLSSFGLEPEPSDFMASMEYADPTGSDRLDRLSPSPKQLPGSESAKTVCKLCAARVASLPFAALGEPGGPAPRSWLERFLRVLACAVWF